MSNIPHVSKCLEDSSVRNSGITDTLASKDPLKKGFVEIHFGGGYRSVKDHSTSILEIQAQFFFNQEALNRRLISGVWSVNSPQSHIVRVYDAGHGKSGVFHSAECVVINRLDSNHVECFFLSPYTSRCSQERRGPLTWWNIDSMGTGKTIGLREDLQQFRNTTGCEDWHVVEISLTDARIRVWCRIRAKNRVLQNWYKIRVGCRISATIRVWCRMCQPILFNVDCSREEFQKCVHFCDYLCLYATSVCGCTGVLNTRCKRSYVLRLLETLSLYVRVDPTATLLSIQCNSIRCQILVQTVTRNECV
ncbi:hypothetical protein TNCV_3588081 [Trichonephila clavipes]|nr:hypothetical protein TNCV_3588081 [Trichonephila clavipes]